MAATLKIDTLQNAGSANPNITLDTAGNATSGGTFVMSTSYLRNRIINGDMRIDQRNAGASVTPTNGQYAVDRWVAGLSVASKYSLQQSSIAPAGFSNSLLATSLSAYSLAAGEVFAVSQYVEGFNVADLGWGAAGAASVTLSFWVRSSLTGTFGGVITNVNFDRTYPFTYTINSAGTWEYKTITIPGDTSGTWGKTSGIGLGVRFSLGAGATYSAAAGAWAAGQYWSATGAQSVVGTNGATFYITGVQLEVGSTATPFERRQYGHELALCQRYYQKSYEVGTVPGASTAAGMAVAPVYYGGSYGTGFTFRTTMRASPTMSYWDAAGNSNVSSYWGSGAFANNYAPITAISSGTNGVSIAPGNAAVPIFIHYTASAEL